MGQTLNTAYKG